MKAPIFPNNPLALRAPVVAVLFALLALFFSPRGAHGAAVTASLSPNSMAVGDAAQLTLTIEGAGQLSAPREIDVEGLTIRYSQRAQRAEFANGRGSLRTELIYTVEAEKPGKYTIPVIEVRSDGNAIRTEPVAFTVDPAGSNAPPDAGGGTGFAEISLGKKTAYVGEMVPAELRLFVPSGVRWRAEQMPVFEGDGFTKQKMPEPGREHLRRDGKDYEVVVFKTAITPSRAGKITVGPTDIEYIAQVPQPRRNRGRSPFDDLLGDGFFDDPFFAQTRAKKVTAKAPAVDLDVKPLPAAGRPASFSGAIGTFTFSAEGSPGKVKVCDPLTMKLTVTGRGNFDRVNAAQIRDADGWHAYPSTGAFKADDELGTSGTKSFEMAVIPEVKKTAMPVFAFSYFSPITEKYVTLTSAPAPLEVEGTAPLATSAAANSVAAAATPVPPKPVVVNDILGLRYDFGEGRGSFEPRYRSRNFAIAAATPAALILAFAALRSRRKDQAAERVARLQKRKSERWRALRNARDRSGFLDAAAELLRLDAALKSGLPEATLDAALVKSVARIDDETATAIDEVFASRAELLYAGTAASDGGLPEQDRTRIVAALERYEKSKGIPSR